MDGLTTALAAKSASSKAALLFGGATVSSIMVMVFLEPQSKKEKFLCFFSTIIFAVCLSSFIKVYFGLTFPDNWDGDLANTGLIIASGMPGWVLVRAFVLTVEKMQGKDFGQIIMLVRGWFK